MKERWLPVVGFDGYYEVSNKGRIRRACDGKYNPKGHILVGGKNHHGYTQVSLWKQGKRTLIRVHKEVMMAFVGIKPDGMEINHIDGVKTNNDIRNLEYVTHAENCHHAKVVGLSPRGERNGHCRLSESKVIEIRKILSEGKVDQTALAKKYGITKSHVTTIKKNRAWKHLHRDHPVDVNELVR